MFPIKFLSVFCFVIAISAQLVYAQNNSEIYGQIWEAKTRAPAIGASVSAVCGDQAIPAVVVSSSGTYSLRGIPHNSECKLSVLYKGMTSYPLTVRSMSATNNANLELQTLRGRWMVNRR